MRPQCLLHGVIFRGIKRFGRRSAITVRIYFLHDDATYKGVGKKTVESTGLLQELRQAVETKVFVRFEEANNQYVGRGENFRCGGKRGKTTPQLTGDMLRKHEQACLRSG